MLCYLCRIWQLHAKTSLKLKLIEPGYYEDGAFGIRIENVVIVKSAETKVWMSNLRSLPFCAYSSYGHFQKLYNSNNEAFLS